MKAKHNYPELFLNKVGDLYWATGHPSQKILPEENWKHSSQLIHKRVAPEEINQNKAQLTLVTEYGNIDYLRSGTEGAPVLLLVPGFPDCWYTFHKILPLLAKDFDVISYSPPGHGYSTYTQKFDFKMDTYCQVLKSVIQRLQLNQVHLIGHSIGGEQSIRTLLQLKSKKWIKSLTLINAWGPSIFPRKTNWDFTEDVTTWPIVGMELVRLFGGKLGGMEGAFNRIFHRPEERPHLQNLKKEYSRPFLNGTSFNLFINRETAHAICEMQREQKRINENVRDYFLETRQKYGYLPQIPILVVGTKHDKIFPYMYARGLFRAIQKHNQQTYFRKIKPSGHMPAIEAPNRLSYQIAYFVKKIEETTTNLEIQK